MRSSALLVLVVGCGGQASPAPQRAAPAPTVAGATASQPPAPAAASVPADDDEKSPHCWVRGVRTTTPEGDVQVVVPNAIMSRKNHGGGIIGLPADIIVGLGGIHTMWGGTEVVTAMKRHKNQFLACLGKVPSVASGTVTAYASFEVGAEGRITDLEIRYSQDMHYVDVSFDPVYAIKVPAELEPVHSCLRAELEGMQFPRPAESDFACTMFRFDPQARLPRPFGR